MANCFFVKRLSAADSRLSGEDAAAVGQDNVKYSGGQMPTMQEPRNSKKINFKFEALKAQEVRTKNISSKVFSKNKIALYAIGVPYPNQ